MKMSLPARLTLSLLLLLLLSAMAMPMGAQTPASMETDTAELPILRLDTGGPTAQVKGLAYTPDGRELLTCGDDKLIYVWDTATGQLKRTIRAWLGEGNQGKLYALAVSPDGRWLACGGWLKGQDVRDSGFGAIRIFDYASGQLVHLLSGHNNVICSLNFSPDSSWLASGSGGGEVRLWQLSGWKTGPVFAEQHTEAVYGMAWSPDSRVLATAGLDKAILLHQIDTGRTLAHCRQAHDGWIYRVAWNPDGRTLATSGDDGAVKLWDATNLDSLTTLKQVSRTRGDVGMIVWLDARTLLCGGTYDESHEGARHMPLYLIDTVSGEERVYWDHLNTIVGLTVAPDGKQVASGGGDNSETNIWNPGNLATEHVLHSRGQTIFATAWQANGQNLFYCTTNGRPSFEKGFNLATRQMSLAPAGVGNNRVKLEAWGERLSFSGQPMDHTLQVGQRRVTLPKANDTIECYSYSHDGESIYVGSSFGLYRIDHQTLAITHELRGHEGMVLDLAVSPDGQTLLTGGYDQILRLWDVRGMDKVQKQPLQPSAWFDKSWRDFVRNHYPDLDLDRNDDIFELYQRLLTIGDPDSQKMISPLSVFPLLSLFISQDNEWIAWTPEGYYDCSLNGAKYAGWHFNRGEDQNAEFYTLDQYASVFYRPDVIEKALARVKFDPPAAVSFTNRPPQITSFKINGQPVYDEGEITITTDQPEFSIELASSGTTALKQPELFYNGRVISQGKFKGPPQVKLAPDKQSLTASYSFTVNNPDNRYKVYTVDERGFKSAAKTIHVVYTGKDASPAFYKLGEKVAKPGPAGTLHVLAIGINQYQNPAMAQAGLGNLEYAEKDAADMAGLWASQQGKLFSQVRTTVLTWDKLGHPVGREDILNAFTVLGKQATGETDSILVFLSGHGLRKDDGFYFLSADADPTSKTTLDKTSPSWLTIGDKLKSFTRVKEIVVLVDACHSGAINPTELGFTWKDKGVVLVTSSRAGQKSYEGGNGIDNGLFTRAMMEGFAWVGGTSDPANVAMASGYAPADSSQDNVLIVGEVLKYATDRVEAWTHGQQTPWAPAYDPALEGKILGVVK